MRLKMKSFIYLFIYLFHHFTKENIIFNDFLIVNRNLELMIIKKKTSIRLLQTCGSIKKNWYNIMFVHAPDDLFLSKPSKTT